MDNIKDLEARIAHLEVEVHRLRQDSGEKDPLETTLPGERVTDWLSGIGGSPGIIIDPGVARTTPCIERQLGEGYKPLLFSRGIIGALDEEQRALYCQEGIISRPPSEAQRARLEAMSHASKLCGEEAKSAPDAQRIEVYFACLGRELRKKGEEIW